MNRQTLSFAVLLLLIPLSGAGLDLYTPALPTMAQKFMVTHAFIKQTITVYLLGLGLGQPCWGLFADRFGRKPILMIAIICFALMCLLTALCHNAILLLVFRALQGLAIAGSAMATKTMVGDLFQGKALAKATALMSVVWAGSPIIAPLIGAYLVQYFSWQACFYTLTAFALLGFSLVFVFIPETIKEVKHINVANTFSEYREIMSNKHFLAGITAMAISYALMLTFYLIAPFYIENVLHLTPTDYGHAAVWIGVAYLFGAMLYRFGLNYLQPQRIFILSLSVIGLASFVFVMICFSGNPSLLAFLLPPIIIIIATGPIFPSGMGLCLALFPDKTSSASALIGSLCILTTALLTALGSYLQASHVIGMALAYLGLSVLCYVLFKAFLQNSLSLLSR